MNKIKNVIEIKHPLLSYKLTKLRDKNCSTINFSQIVSEISSLLAYEVFKDLKTKEVEIETPLAKMKTKILVNEVTLIPIMRAGLGMVNGVRYLVPFCRIGHIGLFRDENNFETKEYYFKIPESKDNTVHVVLDIMIATGNSLDHTINTLKSKNIKNIVFLGIIGSRKGIEYIAKKHPDIKFYIAQIDEKLKNGFIYPGLGDAGDRVFGTK